MLKNKYLTKVCLALLLILFSMEVFQFLITVYAKIVIFRVENYTVTEAETNFLEWFDEYSILFIGCHFLVAFYFGIFYFIWLSRANFNFFLLGDKELTYNTLIVGWRFVIIPIPIRIPIPIDNLWKPWKPYSAFKEIIAKSHQLAFGSVHNKKTEMILFMWWILFLISLLLWISLAKNLQSRELLNLILFLYIFEILKSIFLFYLIYNVDKWQRKANQSKPISLQKS
ncbi:DUF4328 domain-containing protein [Avibacterium avium]|uniref:DUF4328 domain-containing protein n=1 Tax=Avibacterium avium TaxID=751 RepID=A0A379ARI3_AVIAV|nr:DUF4328 domain-containing protein [Avibacterium avium]SUB24298.1 Uncharacterised protein [Avibacterium avium]